MRQLNTEIRQLNLAQLIINIDNAFQEGINRGVQGLFKRGFDPLKGFTRFADTAFLGIGQGIEEFLAKQISGDALGRAFENLLRDVGRGRRGPGGVGPPNPRFRGLTNSLSRLFGGGDGGPQSTQGVGGFIRNSGLGVLAAGSAAFGAARQGSVFSGGISGAALTTGIFGGLVNAGLLTGAAAGPVGLAVAAGIGIIGGILGSIFGRKKSRIDFDLTEALDVQDIRSGLETDIGAGLRRKAISINTKRTGLQDADKDAIRLSIFKLVDQQIERVTDIFRALPNDIFRSFASGLDTVVFDPAGFDFYKKSKSREKVKDRFEQFVAGISGATIADLSTAFVQPLRSIGVRDAEGFVGKQLRGIDELTGEARAAQGEEFLKTIQTLIEAFNILEGNVGIRGSIERARNLSEEFQPRQTSLRSLPDTFLKLVASNGQLLEEAFGEGIPTIEGLTESLKKLATAGTSGSQVLDGTLGGSLPTLRELNLELEELKAAGTLDPETFALWKELRSLILSIPRELISSLASTVSSITGLSQFASGGLSGPLFTQLSDSLFGGIGALREIRGQEGLSLEERRAILQQEGQLIQQQLSLEQELFRKQQEAIEVQREAAIADWKGGLPKLGFLEKNRKTANPPAFSHLFHGDLG